jgi:hypothetical protein
MQAGVLMAHQTLLPAITIIILAEVYNETDVLTVFRNSSIHKVCTSVVGFAFKMSVV